MSSSKSSPKQENKAFSKVVLKPVAPYDLFYQLTYMSAMAAAGLSRAKTFEIAASATSIAATYFAAINTLVNEMRFDYPEACRRIGIGAKSENMRSFLLRLSDALRSGEPLADFLAREAEVQSEEYKNRYERDIEALKQWTNAFSSIVISVALIVIIQIITSMIYSLNTVTIGSLVLSGIMMAFFGAWIIYRSAPKEVIAIGYNRGSAEQARVYRLFRLIGPITLAATAVLYILKVPLGGVLLIWAGLMLPVGFMALRSDQALTKKDSELSTFLRSTGSMATSSGTTLPGALTRIELSSFPTLQPDIHRLSRRLGAQVAPEVCWRRFGSETGSRLVASVTDIFFNAIRIGGDPERVGYLCSIFAARTSQLRAKRRLVGGTFAALSLVMQGIIAILMVFVLSIVTTFATLIAEMMPKSSGAMDGINTLSMGMVQFSPSDLQFLALVTLGMVLMLAVVCALSIIACDGGYKLKTFFYLALTLIISGVSQLIVPPMVVGILESTIR